jgi:hypothetical protein
VIGTHLAFRASTSDDAKWFFGSIADLHGSSSVEKPCRHAELTLLPAKLVIKTLDRDGLTDRCRYFRNWSAWRFADLLDGGNGVKVYGAVDGEPRRGLVHWR